MAQSFSLRAPYGIRVTMEIGKDICLSVLISTRNRSSILPRLFDAMAAMQVPADLKWELLIVNNGSSDNTNAVLVAEADRGRLPLVVLQQPVPGKSRALNLALEKARGTLLVFTDDDVEPAPCWLKAYADASDSHPDFQGFAGRVLPRWLGPLPVWLETEGKFALPRGMINSRDFGLQEMTLPSDVIPGGVNTALRREAVNRMGMFRDELGPGTAVPYAEDTEFNQRLLAHGGLFHYVPEALLYHCNIPERMTKKYAQDWMYNVARCQILAFSKSAGKGEETIPRYLVRQALERMMSWFFDFHPRRRFHKKLKLMTTLGQIAGYRQRSSFASPIGADTPL